MSRLCFLVSLIASLALAASQNPLQAEDGFGAFQGDLVVKLRDDGRTVELVRPFAFTDPAGKTWSVPAGAMVDGASIPQTFWSVIGGPFEGKYREASVIHDYYCDHRSETWQNVHLVFYNGMRANGVGTLTAKIMYAAVYNFGPRWVEVEASHKTIVGQPLLREDIKQAIVKQITENDPPIEEITRISDQLSKIQSIDELQAILEQNAACTPIVDTNLGKTLVLCGMSSQSKKLAAQKSLANLIGLLNGLRMSQTIYLLPAVHSYANDPTPEKWAAVETRSNEVLGLVKLATRATLDAGDSSDPVVAEQSNAIFELLSQRSVMLSQLRQRPQSKDDLLTWNSVYRGLVNQLSDRLTALQKILAQQNQ